MKSHTPGPWRVGKCDGSVVADHPVNEVSGADDVEYYGGHLVAESIALRNQHLIAAAPDLLQLVREAIAIIDEAGGADVEPLDQRDWLKAARAALAKAEGRTEGV